MIENIVETIFPISPGGKSLNPSLGFASQYRVFLSKDNSYLLISTCPLVWCLGDNFPIYKTKEVLKLKCTAVLEATFTTCQNCPCKVSDGYVFAQTNYSFLRAMTGSTDAACAAGKIPKTIPVATLMIKGIKMVPIVMTVGIPET